MQTQLLHVEPFALPSACLQSPTLPALAEPARPILTSQELDELEDCEQTIASGLQTFIEVGRALCTVRDRRLYRERYHTFEQYCRNRWEMSRIHAYRLIHAAEVANLLLPMGNIPMPTSERQVRPLTNLPPETASKAWQLAVEHAAGKPVTTHDVTESVAELLSGTERKLIQPQGAEESDSSLLHDLLLQQMKRLQKHLRENSIPDIIATVDHMQFLVKRYACVACPKLDLESNLNLLQG